MDLERGILIQDPPLELAQRRTGFDPELFDEVLATALEGVERVGLSPAAVEREHQLSPQALAERMLRGQGFQLGNELAVAAEREIGLDAVFERAQA